MTNAFTTKPKIDPEFLKQANAVAQKTRAGQARAKQPGAAKTFSSKRTKAQGDAKQ